MSPAFIEWRKKNYGDRPYLFEHLHNAWCAGMKHAAEVAEEHVRCHGCALNERGQDIAAAIRAEAGGVT